MNVECKTLSFSLIVGILYSSVSGERSFTHRASKFFSLIKKKIFRETTFLGSTCEKLFFFSPSHFRLLEG